MTEMHDFIPKYAELLVKFCNEVKSGDRVLIKGAIITRDLIEAIYEECMKAGAHVNIEFDETEDMMSSFYTYADENQLSYVSEWQLKRVDEIDCFFGVWGEENTRAGLNQDFEKDERRNNATKKLDDKWNEHINSGKIRWVVCLYPTNAYAQDAGMSLYEYKEFIYKSCKLHHKDPIASWKRLRKRQQKIVDYLNTCKRIRVIAPGTDLRFSTKGRLWINSYGTDNMPDGEIYTGPVENSAEGKVRFTFPACYEGNEVNEVELTFKKGKVIKAKAKKNLEFLQKILDTDEGSKQIGEFAIGLNKDICHFTKEVLCDEKIGGTFHIALGSSYPETGTKIESNIHWDMVCDLRNEGKIYTDGRLFLKDGEIVIDL